MSNYVLKEKFFSIRVRKTIKEDRINKQEKLYQKLMMIKLTYMKIIYRLYLFFQSISRFPKSSSVNDPSIRFPMESSLSFLYIKLSELK